MTSTLRERPAVGPAGDTTLQHRPYPHYRIIVLDDDVNTFQHVVKCLVTFLPGLTRDQAWAMAQQVDGEGSAVVWTGPQEQAELYHGQLGHHGLTMAPLEPV
ncbi:MAG: ATP-dependent Clp protease adapter ClpS [Synechococcus sp. SB0665_bin_28]|nr:ATP-dependent Clp protease adapter ClpS [Cyanobacteria bacterium MAG IRC1_bin_28]MXY62468.1 ATP-dependent Clp protease adapter ClpS [Synechococcus sp. SB0665_bin_28]MYF20029.1 ATP-dependent Clp protease adapter ClpS [Synechococcus sp. SB0677_bin_5]MYF36818.1 ATP-dependent Clp protease adapter ClpS [Synechococcus sp. SB0678_bin_12]MYI87140.1 ATP-dependent Clp protease adapter ClpS [Synechococcus sp. SB0672_bin_10]